jgi:hypothetical protein
VRLENSHHLKDVNLVPDPNEMKDKGGQAVQDMKDKAEQAARQGRQGQQGQDKSGSAMDQAKKKMDRTGDGKVDMDDAKKMGEDAVDKVKGLFKKE